MAKTKEIKTNAMRILDKNKVKYEVTMYPCEEFIDGIHVADLLGLPYERCFKTLVASGKSGAYHVFVIPVDKELDMKAAARAAGEKNIELIPVKQITPVTGYVRGGCTAIGMKKNYPVIIQKTAADFDTIAVSGGHLGVQITLSPSDFIKVTRASFADIIE